MYSLFILASWKYAFQVLLVLSWLDSLFCFSAVPLSGCSVSTVLTFASLFIHSPTEGHLPVFAVMNKAAAVNLVCRFLCKYVFITFGYTPSSAITGSYYMNRFCFVKTHQTALQSGCTSLLSHQQWICVPVAPYPCQHLVLSGLWILALRIGVLWYLIIVLVCVSLVIQDVGHLFTMLFVILFTFAEVFIIIIYPLFFFSQIHFEKVIMALDLTFLNVNSRIDNL